MTDTDDPPRSISELTVHVVEDRARAERAVASEIADLVRAKPDREAAKPAVLGLATGSSVAGVYRELVHLHRAQAIDFSRVTTFNLDEYLGLAPDDPACFRRWMRTHFFDEVGIDARRARLPECDVDLAAANAHARDYERAIADAGGLDLQLLGLGRNGHIGFNEPGSTADTRTRVVELHPWTIADAAHAFGGDVERVPRRAITIGVATILEARRIRVLAFGAHKAEAVRAMLHDPIGPEVPATYLRTHSDVTVWADRAAAARVASSA